MDVRKTNGSVEEYDKAKLARGIHEAYKSAGQYCEDAIVVSIINNLYIYEGITSAEIRRQVEESLMSINKKVALAYIEKFDADLDLRKKRDFIKDYIAASNAATGSKFDANANVTRKNIVTLGNELYKENNIKQNRYIMCDKIKMLYGRALADQYLEDLNTHILYKHDESGTPGFPYCVAITMYPFLISGLKELGGVSIAPTDLKSFCGEFINLVYSVSSQFMGAVATPEFLMYLNYFIGKEYGKDYYKESDKVVDLSLKQRTIDKVITDCFEQIVYSINQPTGARNYQAVFWNIAYYDKPYFESLFGDFYFPDGSKPDWNGLSWLQKRFMKWFNAERTKTMLTFPVETMALLCKDGDVIDEEWGDFTAEMYSQGHSFFTYMSDNADSLSSCCRLRNEIQDNGFSYTLGAGGVSTGSKSVLTINLNRCIQYAVNNNIDYKEFLADIVDLCHKVQLAYNENLKELQKHGMLPLFDAGYINISRQYLTIGVNGLVEAAEFCGLQITNNPDYKKFVQDILGIIEKYNKQYRTKDVLFNCEMIPAENVGVKHAKWDREDGYFVPRDCYNSYFYVVEDDSLSIIDKFQLHGAPYIEHLTGGSALHMNLEEHLSQQQYRQLLRIAAKEGCNYFTFNIPNTICNDCGHIDKRYLKECPHCHSKDVDYMTRIIGYLKRISNFSQARQQEAGRRYYNRVDK